MGQPEIPFPISSEVTVREAFSRYTDRFGYTISSSKDSFPDYTLTDEGGNTVRCEAETLSRNFFEHGHDPTGCDLIVCWWDNLPTNPLPTLELGKHLTAVSEPDKPNEYVSVYDGGDHIKTLELTKNEQKELVFRIGWYHRKNKIVSHKSPNTPKLTAHEFASLLDPIDDGVLRDAFVGLDLDALVSWHDNLGQTPRSNRNGRTLSTTSLQSGGEKTLKIKDDRSLLVDEYLPSGGFHPKSQNGAELWDEEFTGVFAQIPAEIREQTFVYGDLTALWDWHTQEP